ncbi:MAG: hypothetical protein H7098_12215, partial [Oligoflexus sp.]|nr:hypothetical protein [Pseudopedobacter sp.]
AVPLLTPYEAVGSEKNGEFLGKSPEPEFPEKYFPPLRVNNDVELFNPSEAIVT